MLKVSEQIEEVFSFQTNQVFVGIKDDEEYKFVINEIGDKLFSRVAIIFHGQ